MREDNDAKHECMQLEVHSVYVLHMQADMVTSFIPDS